MATSMSSRGVGVESESEVEISCAILGIVVSDRAGDRDDKLRAVYGNNA